MRVLFFLFLSITEVFSQGYSASLKERALQNLELVCNDFELRARVQIDNTGIVVYESVEKDKVMFSLLWKEVPKFIEIVENWDLVSMNRAFREKDSIPFLSNVVPGDQILYKPLPTKWSGLRVVLDPGHFAGNWSEAVYEERYVKARGKEVGLKRDVQFYEADLTFGVCAILKKLIEARGGIAEITRPYASSSLGRDFNSWMGTYRVSLDNAFNSGDVSPELYEALKDTTDKKFIFNNFYKNMDFRKRVEVINRFHPDITVAVHLNSKEGNRRDAEGFLSPVPENFNMVFVPGGFLKNEIVKTDQEIDFLRLLVSPDITNSLSLAKAVLKCVDSVTRVPSIPPTNNIYALRDASVFTGDEGVYARNLAITRLSRGAVIYLEALYQDNVEEIKRLSLRDYTIDGYWKKLSVSSRCKDIADGILLGIDQYLSANEKKKRN